VNSNIGTRSHSEDFFAIEVSGVSVGAGGGLMADAARPIFTIDEIKERK
jgi:hypothetical protein